MIILALITYVHILLKTITTNRLPVTSISAQSRGEESLAFLEGESTCSKLVHMSFTLPDHFQMLLNGQNMSYNINMVVFTIISHEMGKNT